VSVFEVGIGFSVFFRYFFKIGSVFGIGISKYRDIGIGIFGIFSTFALVYLKFVRSLSTSTGVWLWIQNASLVTN